MKSIVQTRYGQRRSTTLIITEEMHDELGKLAAHNDVTPSLIIRRAVWDFLGNLGVTLTTHLRGDELLGPLTVGGSEAPPSKRTQKPEQAKGERGARPRTTRVRQTLPTVQ